MGAPKRDAEPGVVRESKGEASPNPTAPPSSRPKAFCPGGLTGLVLEIELAPVDDTLELIVGLVLALIITWAGCAGDTPSAELVVVAVSCFLIIIDSWLATSSQLVAHPCPCPPYVAQALPASLGTFQPPDQGLT